MWDEECEAKALSLLEGFTNDEGKPPLREQQEVANWLNQMMPYPGWEVCLFRILADEQYWVVDRDGVGTVYCANRLYSEQRTGKVSETLIGALTTLEMGL